jgi:hypothetical protein
LNAGIFYKNPTMSTALKSILVITLGILFATCQKELKQDNGSPFNIPVTTVTASVAGRIVNELSEPVKGAIVTAGTSSAVTDINGEFTINNASLIDQSAMIKVEKQGYFTGSRTFITSQGQKNYVEVQLLPKTIIGNITATSGGSLTVSNGSSITLPANAVVVESTGANYSGAVQVAMAWIDPTSTTLYRQMPGDLRGIDGAGRENNLQSYGMLAVELIGSGGEKLQIAAGKKASLKFPLPSGIQASAPATIALWSFNETTALWKQEGTATKSGNVYLADVSHFSFWNCDAAFLNVNFAATFKDQNGNPLVNREIKITRSGPSNGIILTTYAYTDTAGHVAGRVPQNESLLLQVMGSYTCTQAFYSQNLGPYAPNSNVNLGVVTVNISGANVFTISGTVNTCNGAPVTNGYVNLITGNGVYRSNISNGSFSKTIWSCTPTLNISYYAVDNTNTQQSNTVTATINSGTNNLPVIVACGTTSTEFMNITFNGVSYQMPDSLGGSAWAFQTAMTNITGSNMSQGISLNMNANGQSMGTFTIDNMDFINGQNWYRNGAVDPVIVYTEYGGVNQFIAGSVTGVLQDSTHTTSGQFTCNFRVRRLQ